MLLNLLITIFFLFILVTTINSSHFLGGSITWRIQNISNDSTSVAILITQTYSWTYVTGRCDNSSIANNQVVSGSGGTLTCSPSCPSGFGSVSATPYCTDVSSLNGIAVGQRLDSVVIPAGSDFSIIYAGSAWNSHVGSGSWSITSRINLVRRSDNNMFNNAPVVTVMSPVNIQVNQTTRITASVSDADGDIVRCRWANNASNGVNECGSVCPPSSLPANTVLYANCSIEIMGSTVGNMYAVAFIVEDFISSSSTSPLSSVPVQFIVKIIAPPSCSTAPETTLIGPSCTTVEVNETFTSQLFAINNCGVNVSIIDIATLSFSGMLQSSVIELNSFVYYKTLTWTPTINQLGYQVMCAMALNSQYAQSPQYCFTFYVTEYGVDTCPGVTNNSIVTTTVTTTTTKKTTPNIIDWPIIASLGALVLLLAIIYSSCILYRSYKRSIGKRRLKLYNNNSVGNPSPLPSTEKHSPTAISIDPINTVEDETINKSTICPISSNDDKVDDNDVEQVFESKIIYPRNNAFQIPSNGLESFIQPYHASPIMRNENIHVKNVPLPVEQMITESRLSQIETIDLSSISPKSEQFSDVHNNSITSSATVQTELIYIMRNEVITANIYDIFEVPVEIPRKLKIKHKKLSGIHFTIRKPPKPKQ